MAKKKKTIDVAKGGVVYSRGILIEFGYGGPATPSEYLCRLQ